MADIVSTNEIVFSVPDIVRELGLRKASVLKNALIAGLLEKPDRSSEAEFAHYGFTAAWLARNRVTAEKNRAEIRKCIFRGAKVVLPFLDETRSTSP